jgi:NADH:ubiquinone oxidoreductase subunit 5 (subunit L)/multisubunit Na+/H+ antiporter MnhA subunit
MAWTVPVMAILCSALTAFYVTRLGVLIFLGKNRVSLQPGKETLLGAMPRAPWVMVLPLWILAGCSLWVCWSPANPIHVHSPWLSVTDGTGPWWLPWILVALALTAGLLALVLFGRGPWVRHSFPWLQQLSLQHFFYDRLLHQGFAAAVLRFGQILKWIDHAVVDALVNLVGAVVVRRRNRPSLSAGAAWTDLNIIDRLVNGAAWGTLALGTRVKAMQAGRLQLYLIYTLLAVLLLALAFYYLIAAS